MLTKAIEVMKYIRASAGRAGISVVFEDVNQPRHDGKTIFLPKITAKTTDLELQQLMASVDHEVAHDRFSSFKVLKDMKVDPNGILMFVWNFLEDSRINNIEAVEYRGFRENWDETSSILVGQILARAKKSKAPMAVLTTALMCWEASITAPYFPKIELVTNKTRPNKKVLDVLNNFSDRLIDCQSILDKTLGTEATYKLALEILKELGQEAKEELMPTPKVIKSSDDKDGKKADVTIEGKPGETEEASKTDEAPVKQDEQEYKIIEIKVTKEDLDAYSLTMPEEDSDMGKVGINFKPVETTFDWDLTDYQKFLVVDYPRTTGDSRFFEKKKSTFLKEYDSRVAPMLISQENFAQQVRKLIQIRAKVQREYGVKKGKLDQSRLSRICFKAPGFSERIFKNKIENKVLDAAITVLVDMSGSMSGDKAFYALASTLLVNEVCSTLNIPVEILGFTDGPTFEGYAPVMFIYKGFNDLKMDEDHLKNYFALSSNHMIGNPDGENILWAHDRLIRRKEKKKILVVMSDGSPAASKGGSDISGFTHKVIQEIEKSKVVDIYGLGLCSEAVEYYYKSHSVVRQTDQIPSKLLELIERKIINVK
jgi:cobalamin biosynthesis protein CobT